MKLGYTWAWHGHLALVVVALVAVWGLGCDTAQTQPSEAPEEPSASEVAEEPVVAESPAWAGVAVEAHAPEATEIPEPTIVASFDLAAGRVPQPNDVVRDADAGRLAIPSDWGFFLRDQLDGRDGWSTRAPATIAFGGAFGGTLDETTIGADSVRIYRVAGAAYEPVEVVLTGIPEEAPTSLRVRPVGGSWARGSTYVAVVVGGETGLRGSRNEPVVADTAFALVRQEDDIADDAWPPGWLESDIGWRVLGLRNTLSPHLARLTEMGVARADIASLWQFTTTEAPEIWMDEEAQKMPIPCDLLRDPQTGRIALPLAGAASEIERALRAQLNAYDGFALSAELVFELTAPVDANTLANGVALYEIAAGGLREVAVDVGARKGGQEVVLDLGGAVLRPATDYAVVVRDSLLGALGEPVAPMLQGMLLLAETSLLDDGSPAGSGFDQTTARRSEPMRQQLAQLFADLAPAEREQAAAAWTFRTMDIATPMLAFRDAAEHRELDPDPYDITTKTPLQALWEFPLAAGSLLWTGKVIDGAITVPDFIDPLTRRFYGDGAWRPQEVRFTMTIPRRRDEGDPLPVVIFGHPIVTERRMLYAIGDALAREGLAGIAIDLPFHGERTQCADMGPICSENPFDRQGPLWCPRACARDGVCAPDGRCVDAGGAESALATWPVLPLYQASGAHFLDLGDTVGIRDHIYQAVSDVSTLLRSLRRGDWRRATGYAIDPDVGFVGQSLGGIVGAVFVAAEENLSRAVLNVPGGDLVELLHTSPWFAPHYARFLQDQNLAVGSDAFYAMLNAARWLFDAVDPQSFAPYILHRSLETGAMRQNRAVMVQMALFDTIIGNSQTEVITDLGEIPRYDYVAEHAFLAIPLEPAYPRGSRDMARFLRSGELPRAR